MTISLATESIAARTKKLLSQMTLEEKLAQLGSNWVYDLQTNGQLDPAKFATHLKHGIGQITRLGGASTFDPRALAKAANTVQRYLLENTRMQIPALVHEECCMGAMVSGGTVFPQMIGLASTFEPELAEQMTAVIGRQLRAVGAHQGLAPVLDVARDPRWGRLEETFGEDPTLVAHFGMAYVRGLQGPSLVEGVMATGKHFVGHSMSLGGLNCGPVQLGEREIWNTFLPPFQAVIRDAGLASIMCAYPELDGEVVAGSYRYMTALLRNALGFDGVVVSDYHAVNMIHDFHNAAPDLAIAGQMALKAGVDVELPTTYVYGDPLKAALEAGDIDLEFVDLSVERHLRKKFELGLFENPYVDEASAPEIYDTPDQRPMAREIAVKSMVLLKNDGVLPLAKTVKTIAVIGPNANEGRHQLGDYSYPAMMEHMSYSMPDIFPAFRRGETNLGMQVVTVLDGIRAAAPDANVVYARGCDVLDPSQSGFEAAIKAAQQADAVVLVLGERSGLVPDCTTGEFRDSVDLRLPGAQEELAKALIAVGKPVVTVLINGRPLAISWLAENSNAILEAWLPGEEGGAAVAEVLFGDANPGGKLPVSFPRHVGQVPSFYNHKPSGLHSRPYGNYVQESTSPLYAFGHGLSYSTFDYSAFAIARAQAKAGESVDVSVKVTNSSSVYGEEVVQLYIRDPFATSPRPVLELKGYKRLGLEPNETQELIFHLPVDQLAFFDTELRLVVEAGKIEVMVGSSSQDIRAHGEFNITSTKSLPNQQRVFVCPVDVR